MSERALLHQVHLGKLAADICASAVSSVLLWYHALLLGVLVRLALPIAGSAIVLARFDAERLRATRRGRYVLAHMPAWCQAVRLAGDLLTAVGAWWHQWAVIALGLIAIAAGWSHGALPRHRTASQST